MRCVALPKKEFLHCTSNPSLSNSGTTLLQLPNSLVYCHSIR